MLLACRVTTVLVLLAVGPPPPVSHAQMAVPVVIMCCREVTMSALREWAASAGGAAHKVRCSCCWRAVCDSSSMRAALHR